MDSSKLQYQDIVKKMTSDVIDTIGRQIENESQVVGGQPIDSKVHRMGLKLIYHKDAKPVLDQLSQIKLSKQIEIRQIERKEDILKKSTVLQNSHVSKSKSYTKFEPSEFTQEEMQQIKIIIKKQKRFERNLIDKENELNKWVLQQQKSQQQLRKQQLLEKCQQRKKQLKKQRQELEQKKLKRQKQLEEEIEKIKQIKERKKLYEKLQEEWNKKQLNEQEQKIKNWNQQKHKKLIDKKQIEDHQKKYLQLKNEKAIQRQKTVEQVLSKSKLHLPFGPSKFLQSIKRQEEELALLEKEKIIQKENHVAQKKIYSKQVKEIFFPKIKQQKQETERDQKDLSNISMKEPLKSDQYYKLGNDYMRYAHQKITRDQIQKDKQSLQIPSENGGYSAFYKNYLKELKGQGNKKRYTVKDFQRTLSNPQLSSVDKLKKVKRMMQEKQKQVKKSDTELIDAIKAKMTILKELIR